MGHMTPQLRKIILKHMRHNRGAGYDPLQRRARLKAVLAECTEDGKVAFVTSGTDCDGYRYHSAYHDAAPTSVYALERMFDSHYEGLDGPGSIWIEKPSAHPEGHDSYCVWE